MIPTIAVLALGFFGVGDASTPSAALAMATIRRHCVPCHDGERADLDLRQLTPQQSDVWHRIYEQVESYRMPPPNRASIARRFPMDELTRGHLLQAIEQIATVRSDPPPMLRHVPFEAWQAIVEEFARPVLGSKELENLWVYRWPGGPSNRLLAAQQFAAEQEASTVCSMIVDRELTLSPGERKILVGLPSSPLRPATRDHFAFVDFVFRRIYRRSLTPTEASEAIQLVRTVRSRGGSWADTWRTLCSHYLTSPLLLYASIAPDDQ